MAAEGPVPKHEGDAYPIGTLNVINALVVVVLPFMFLLYYGILHGQGLSLFPHSKYCSLLELIRCSESCNCTYLSTCYYQQ